MKTSTTTAYRRVNVDGVEIFYREAGSRDAPTLLLLHGFPSSSYHYRRLIELLADRFHVVAPDYPGFGYSDAPRSRSEGGTFVYSFDSLADWTARFCQTIGLARFVLYMFDYGGPVGMRIAEHHPEWISGLIVQNANAYAEGLSPIAADFITLPEGGTGAQDKALGVLTEEVTRSQYVTGATQPERISPDTWTVDQHFLELPGRKRIQLDLMFDYHSNVARYDAWQAWLRKHQPPALIVWGRNDPFFTEAGARAYLQDLPHAQLHLFDTGHFALEEEAVSIARLIVDFAGRGISP
ncbi:MAG TPA: alpha/beta hydrolase [Povalibacter sp.]